MNGTDSRLNTINGKVAAPSVERLITSKEEVFQLNAILDIWFSLESEGIKAEELKDSDLYKEYTATITTGML